MKNKTNLHLDRMSVVQLIGYSLHVVTRMTGNTYFTTPSPALSAVTSAISALQTAYDNAQGAGPAQTAVMHQKRAALELLMTALGHYVEDRANDPANIIVGSETVILSAGMNVKSVNPRQKVVFSVVPGEFPGTVELTAPSVKRGTHEWQYSPDAGNPDTWISADPTTKAAVIIAGLTSFKRYYFRHRVVLKSGPSVWDAPINVVVL